MADATLMLKAYDNAGRMLPQVIQPLEQSVTVLNASERAAQNNAMAMLFYTETVQRTMTVVTQVRKEVGELAKAQEKLNQATDKSAKKASTFVTALKKIDVKKIADAGKPHLERFLNIGAQQQTALDQISTRAGGSAAGKQIFDQTAAQALNYGQDVNAALAGTQRFMAKTTDPGQLEKLNMLAMRLSQLNPGKGLEGATGAISQMLSGDTKALSSDYNIPETAVNQGAIKSAVKQGDVNGMIAAMDQLLNKQNMTKAAFETMMDTPAVKWKRVVDTFNFQLGSVGREGINALGPMFDTLLEALNGEAVTNFISGFGTGLSMVGTFLSGVVGAVSSFLELLNSGGGSASMMLFGIGAALVLMTALLWGMIAPVVAQAIAWLGVYWPLLLIAAGIGLLIGLLMSFGVSGQEIVGFVVGLFYGLFATLYNLVATAYNLFLSFAEFMINLFINPVYAIKKLIYDLVMTFGGYMYDMLRSAEDFASGFVGMILKMVNGGLKHINWLIDGINNLLGTDFKKKELLSEDDLNLHILSDGLKSALDSYKAPEMPDNVVSFDRMQLKDTSGAVDEGRKLGSESYDKFANKLNNFGKSGFGKDPSKDKNPMGTGGMVPGSGLGVGNPANTANIGSVGNVGSVDRINETVDISSEDLKMMRELAEMKNIQNFVTLQPSISFGDTHVRQQSDINTIIAHISEKLERDIASSVDAVYG
ncbi:MULTISPECIES: hypothetical protein [Paenibacillus]|uniref:hypothetical protein n=1 Tax=Paenibacillus TaxID=44249 RepID=UPI002FE08E96